MLITFLRHATAEEPGLSTSDAERSLVEKGEKQVKRVARFCLVNKLIPQSIFCSPLVRAQQTARLLYQELPGCPLPRTADWLSLHTTTTDILLELSRLAEQAHSDVWLVGHEPSFSATISRLITTAPDYIEVKKASITRIEAHLAKPVSAKLLWSVPCSLMR